MDDLKETINIYNDKKIYDYFEKNNIKETIDDLKETINISNNKKIYDYIGKDNLVKCERQLTDKKKISFGYDPFDSVLDVIEGGYAISYGDDYLLTYGIASCCGVVLYHEQKSILFHLDGTTTPEKVKNITDSFGFDGNAKVLIFPGVMCGMPGSFEYEGLGKIYNNEGYDTTVYRINGTLGYVVVSGSDIKIGSALTKIETVFEKQMSHKL